MSRRWPSALFVAAWLAVSSCSVLYSSLPEGQCATDADCLGSELSGRKCDLDYGICVSNTQRAARCESTVSCTALLGNPALCGLPGTACVPLTVQGCEVAGDWQDPTAAFIGTIAARTFNDPPNNEVYPYGVELVGNINAGLDEWNGAAPRGYPYRRLAAVHCDSAGSAETAERMAEHLARTVHVPLLLVGGDLELTAAQRALTRLDGADAGPSQSSARPLLSCLDCYAALEGADELTWSASPPLEAHSELVAWRIGSLAERIRIAGERGASGEVRLLILEQQVPGMAALVAAVEQRIAASGTLLSTRLPISGEVVTSVDLDQAAQAVRDVRADIVFAAADSAFVKYYLDRIEDGLASARPHYVLVQPGRELRLLGQRVTEPSRVDLVDRISGTALVGDEDVAHNFRELRSLLQRDDLPAPDNTAHGYDAAYLAAYAFMAADLTMPGMSTLPWKLTGGDVARGMRWLAGGADAERVNVGPRDITNAYDYLRRARNIALVGASRVFRWDGQRTVSSDIGLWCLMRGDAGVQIRDDAGPTWSASSREIDGTTMCSSP